MWQLARPTAVAPSRPRASTNCTSVQRALDDCRSYVLAPSHTSRATGLARIKGDVDGHQRFDQAGHGRAGGSRIPDSFAGHLTSACRCGRSGLTESHQDGSRRTSPPRSERRPAAFHAQLVPFLLPRSSIGGGSSTPESARDAGKRSATLATRQRRRHVRADDLRPSARPVQTPR